MGQCIGYGKFKGACPNCTAEMVVLYFARGVQN